MYVKDTNKTYKLLRDFNIAKYINYKDHDYGFYDVLSGNTEHTINFQDIISDQRSVYNNTIYLRDSSLMSFYELVPVDLNFVLEDLGRRG